MRKTGLFLLAALLLLSGCSGAGQVMDGPGMVNSYNQIDQETAKQMMEQDDGHIVVDVRRLDEFESGHIPGAICIPNESIETEPPEELPNPSQIILIYCRSGRRSKEAAEKLFNMGYYNVYEFGGIIDWTGETTTGQVVLLSVEANPTTGYSWQAAQEGEHFDIRTHYTAAPQSQPIAGAGGQQYFILTPKAPGEAELTFTYSRPWEPNETDPQIRCIFEIAEDFSITVIADGAAAASEHGYIPTIRIY